MQNEIRKALAILIRTGRQRQQLTQQQLADKIGVSLRYLQGLEKGEVDPKLSLLENLAVAIGIQLSELLRLILHSDKPDLGDVILHYSSPTLDHAVQICDRDGLITYVNRGWEAMSGYDHREVVGQMYIWDLMLSHPDDRTGLKEYLAFLVQNQPKPTPYLNVNRRKDGQIFEITILWNYIYGRSREVVGFVSSCFKN